MTAKERLVEQLRLAGVALNDAANALYDAEGDLMLFGADADKHEKARAAADSALRARDMTEHSAEVHLVNPAASDIGTHR